jgi:copper/silver efflux system protein
MIEKVLSFSIKNPFLVLLTTLFLVIASVWSIKNSSLDALPDLSSPQVIVEINWEGQSPEIIEEQGTYPLISQLLSLGNIDTVRGFSSYGNGMIYIIFKEGVDLYWARNRVMEELSFMQSQLPPSMKVALGPDASGVGWVFEYALTSKTKNLAELRSLQDHYYKYALLGVEGVSEVASIGGFVPTYEVTINNDALVMYDLSMSDITKVLKQNNNDTGGRIVIQNGYEWMVQAKGYLTGLEAMNKLVVTRKGDTPITLGDIATLTATPANRRGLAELNGNGEVVGGIVMMRYDANAQTVLENIHKKLEELKMDDVNLIIGYDRSELIDKAINTLKSTLFKESLIVIIVIALFLMHLRSSLIVLIVLPLTVGTTFILMKLFGIGSNMMSLGGLAIAIGTMVDATIVMIENAHKSIHRRETIKGKLSSKERIEVILDSSKLVGRPIFLALTLVVVSFLPIFALSGQEGLLFTPLAFTKTFAMAAGALFSITLVPVLMIFFLKGNIESETKNPINNFFMKWYQPLIVFTLRYKRTVLAFMAVLLLSIYPLYKSLEWEFMPSINEQSFMYMPVTPYGISIDQSKMLLQKSDAIIKSFPEVATVFGKAGRADTATDPAPLGMLETIITLKPKSQWREGMTYDKLRSEMDKALEIPGLVNSWTYPIRGRIDMLRSGIRTPLGIKLYGDDATLLQKYALKIESILRNFKESDDVLADQASAGYYIDINIDEEALQQYGLTKQTLLEYTSSAIGGVKVSTMYEGIERYPISVRLEESERNSIESIQNIQIKTDRGFVPLSSFATVSYRESASIIKSEMATPVSLISITPKESISASEYKTQAKELLKDINLPAGFYMEWAGESEYLELAMQKIIWIVPVVVMIILLLIFLALRRMGPTLIVFFTLPFALLGGVLYIKWLGFSMSVAVIVGFLALLGVAAETAIVMIVYLQESLRNRQKNNRSLDEQAIKEAIFEGAVQRLRPKLMTVFAILAGLLPIMFSEGVGSEVMQRIAAPMIGGIISSAILSLIIIPLLFEMYTKQKLKKDSHHA